MKVSFDNEEILSAIDRVAKKTMTMDLTWDWPCGVAYYGLAEAYKATGKTEYMEFLKNWVDEYIEMGLPSWNVNTCAMGHCLITLYEYTGDKKYWDLVMSKIDYLRNDALRFGDHVLQHTVSSNNDFPEQCWADTLFMAAFLMLRVGSKLRMLNPDDPKDAALMEYQPQAMDIINDSLNQYYWHIQYLQNKETSLWYHGYNNVHKDHMSGFYWGRANAWAAYTMSQVKKNLYDWYLFPPCMDVECSLRDQLAALKLVQTENGLWRTILDDEEAYEEVSASAGIAAAMQSKTNKVGFIGGQTSDTITRFEAGFTAGAKSVKPDIDVQVQYAESFSDAAKGTTIASTMYASGVDVIYQAAGGTGTGVFTAAKEVNEKLDADSDKKVWVIGVDRDQTAEGDYTSSDKKKSNFVLTSTIKQVGTVVKDIANGQVKGDKFEGGKTKTYGIKDGGVDIVTSNLPSDIKDAVEKAKEQIKNGELKPTDGLSK